MPKCPRHKTELIKISDSSTLKNGAKILYSCSKCKELSNLNFGNSNFKSLTVEERKTKLSYQWCIDSEDNIYFYYSGWHLHGKSNGTFIFR